MYSFKSQNTYEKLYPINPGEPEFLLDSHEKIDQKFKVFCNQYARKELSIQPHPNYNPQEIPKEISNTKFLCPSTSPESRRKNSKNKTGLFGKRVNFKSDDAVENKNLSEDEKLWALLEEKIKQNLKKKDKENPLVKYFKNPLIAAVIESLIVKTIESTFKIKLDNLDNNEDLIPNHLMKLFNISPIALSTMGSKQEKLQFVIQSMAKNIDESLDHLNHAREIQDKKIMDFDLKFSEDKMLSQNEQKDIFEWLQIKTKYSYLKKSLRASILEKLNHVDKPNFLFIYKHYF